MKKQSLLYASFLAGLFASCQSDIPEMTLNQDDEAKVSFAVDFSAEDALLTRAEHNFEYYIAISSDAVDGDNITSGYVGRFTSLSEASIALKKGTEYSFYITAFEDAGYTYDLSSLCATQGEFVQVSTPVAYAPAFADQKVDRYFGSTSKTINTSTTIAVDGTRYAYGINVNIAPPLEGKVVLSSESPAFLYTVLSTDEAIVESDIFCLAGVVPEASKSVDVTMNLYNADGSVVATTTKSLTIARNHSKTIRVTSLDPNANFSFNVDDDDMEDDGEEDMTPEVSLNMHKGHEYVDLGIKDSEGKTIYWATMNLGANSPDAYGDYYYKATTSASAETYVEIDQDYFGNVTYDAANSQWGGSWRLPSKEEFEALINTTNFTWTPTVVNNKNVYRVESKINGNSIILPLAGSGFNDGNLYDTNTAGFYLSGSSTSTDYVITLQIRNGLIQVLTGGNKFVKWSVRPVFTETTKVEEHEFVDLGLPSGLKWAKCNIGANLPEEIGQRYAWGETSTKTEFSQDNYELLTHGIDKDGFETDIWVELEDISGTKYDVAHQLWGSTWRMPTYSDYYELCNNCTWKWGSMNSQTGFKITGSNGNWIFLPESGYWSSTSDGHDHPSTATGIDFYESGVYDIASIKYRYDGRLIRPVKE